MLSCHMQYHWTLLISAVLIVFTYHAHCCFSSIFLWSLSPYRHHIAFPGFLNQMVPGKCLRVQMLKAEIFPQRVSFWTFSFLAWQSFRVLASGTKSMCACALDPCFIVTKGTMILRTPLESQATGPHCWLSESSIQNWQWAIELELWSSFL